MAGQATLRKRNSFLWLGAGFAWLALGGVTAWSATALYFDLAFLRPPILTSLVYLAGIAALAYAAKRRPLRMAIILGGFLVVLICWLSLKPSNDRPWQANLAQTPWAEIDGNRIAIHNFRNCDYRTEFDYSCQWLTKTVFLSQLRGMDMFVDYWGLPGIMHPVVSFQFGDNDYVATSIEARYQIGQGYSAIHAFFRQFTLIYVFGDERDLIRVRTNYRSNENVYLFHMNASPESSRLLFLEYLQQANRLREHPRWFNAADDNCTTNIFKEMAATGYLPAGTSRFAWWILLNGWAPEMLYRGGNLAGNLPFPELMRRANIDPVARTLDDASDFSRRIRMNRPGFEFLPPQDASPQRKLN